MLELAEKGLLVMACTWVVDTGATGRTFAVVCVAVVAGGKVVGGVVVSCVVAAGDVAAEIVVDAGGSDEASGYFYRGCSPAQTTCACTTWDGRSRY